jgi:hypothetical protein
MNSPTSSEPCPKMRTAIAGMSVVYGLMAKLTMPRVKSMRRMGSDPIA